MNNPLCEKMPVITNSSKLRTYTTPRYYTDDEIIRAITRGKGIQVRGFKGRVMVPGTATGPALVSKEGFNTLASFQKSLMFNDKKATCSDQNNKDLYQKEMAGKALCMPQTIGSTTGGMVLFFASSMGISPTCLLFSRSIDFLAATGAILSDILIDNNLPTINNLGEEFLDYVNDDVIVEILEDGIVRVREE